jgi:hypothetical protein
VNEWGGSEGASAEAGIRAIANVGARGVASKTGAAVVGNQRRRWSCGRSGR